MKEWKILLLFPLIPVIGALIQGGIALILLILVPLLIIYEIIDFFNIKK